MNGLKYIRTQCNFSLSELAERLEVSRQIISAWETGKKQIPENRKKQLSEFFGLNKDYFGEINEVQKKELLGKAMFRYSECSGETYRYKPNLEDERQIAYFLPEKQKSLDEEFLYKQKQQKDLIERINTIISGPTNINLRDQIFSINRGTTVFELTADLMTKAFSQGIIQRMPYYHGIVEILEALYYAIGDEPLPEPENEHLTDRAWIKECRDLFVNHFKTVIPVDNPNTRPKSHLKKLTEEELSAKIAQAEKEFAEKAGPAGCMGAAFMLNSEYNDKDSKSSIPNLRF